MVGIGLRMGPSVQLRQKLTIEQSVTLHFGDFVSTPSGICPHCNHNLTEEEIRKGFSDNLTDFRTTCPKCQTKFLAHLIITQKDGEKASEEVIFLCPVQTLDKMRAIKASRSKLGVKFLSQNDRQLFYNMIRHWGTYEKALEALNEYINKEHP